MPKGGIIARGDYLWHFWGADPTPQLRGVGEGLGFEPSLQWPVI